MFPATGSGYSYRGTYDKVVPRNESLRNCVDGNQCGYEQRAKTIGLIIQVIQETLKTPSLRVDNPDGPNPKMSIWKKDCIDRMDRELGWSKEIEAYKFFLQNEDPKRIEDSIRRLEKKERVSISVAKIFEAIHLSPAFRENPTEYIQNWIQIIPEGSEKEHAKVMKRLNSIQDSGSFSAAGELYVKG